MTVKTVDMFSAHLGSKQHVDSVAKLQRMKSEIISKKMEQEQQAAQRQQQQLLTKRKAEPIQVVETMEEVPIEEPAPGPAPKPSKAPKPADAASNKNAIEEEKKTPAPAEPDDLDRYLKSLQERHDEEQKLKATAKEQEEQASNEPENEDLKYIYQQDEDAVKDAAEFLKQFKAKRHQTAAPSTGPTQNSAMKAEVPARPSPPAGSAMGVEAAPEKPKGKGWRSRGFD